MCSKYHQGTSCRGRIHTVFRMAFAYSRWLLVEGRGACKCGDRDRLMTLIGRAGSSGSFVPASCRNLNNTLVEQVIHTLPVEVFLGAQISRNG
jgi:hypothetical protein